MKHRIHVTLLFVFMGALAVESSAQTTLAEAARKERERQKKVQSKAVLTKGVSLTPSTVTPNPVDITPVPEAEKKADAAAPDKPSGPTDNKGRDQNWWRNAFAEARAAVTRAENKVSLLELKLKQLNAELLGNTFMFNKENRLAPQITTTKAEIETAKADAEAARKKIPELEEELRRSGGLPGWAR